ncbi:MAG: preprotein translocase subunit SecG [Gammaproteobacteria bacterium]|nr:preprotein translocase subunit SecG [Gammaproteobacteria bacterium]
MDSLETLILVFHVLAALAIIGLVLIQHGKGADMGSGFGAGASSTVFGSGGAGNFLSRLTTGIAIAFFITSIGLACFAKEKSQAVGGIGIPVVEQVLVEETPVAPEESAGELPAFQEAPESEIPEG